MPKKAPEKPKTYFKKPVSALELNALSSFNSKLRNYKKQVERIRKKEQKKDLLSLSKEHKQLMDIEQEINNQLAVLREAKKDKLPHKKINELENSLIAFRYFLVSIKRQISEHFRAKRKTIYNSFVTLDKKDLKRYSPQQIADFLKRAEQIKENYLAVSKNFQHLDIINPETDFVYKKMQEVIDKLSNFKK